MEAPRHTFIWIPVSAPRPREHFLSNYFAPPSPALREPRPEPTRVTCPACLRKIGLTEHGRLARHGPQATCPGYDVWRWTEEGPPQPVTGEARAWLPALKLMAAGKWETAKREWGDELGLLTEGSTGSWDAVADALRTFRVATRNHWERGVPYDFYPEEKEG